jgi:hypothetical protein
VVEIPEPFDKKGMSGEGEKWSGPLAGVGSLFGEEYQNAAGQTQRNIARVDLSNLRPGENPHLNQEVQINDVPQPWLDPHTPIDVSTARPGDF